MALEPKMNSKWFFKLIILTWLFINMVIYRVVTSCLVITTVENGLKITLKD